MNPSDLTDHFRREAQDAPDVDELLRDIEHRIDRRTGQRRRWAVLSAVAAVVLLVVVTAIVAVGARRGSSVPSDPGGPSASSVRSTQRAGIAATELGATELGATDPNAVDSQPYSEPVLPSATLPTHAVGTSTAAGLVAVQLPDIVSPITLPDPPAGLTRHVVMTGPRALAEIWEPATGSNDPQSGYGYVVTEDAPVDTPAGASAVSVPSTALRSPQVAPTTVGGRSFRAITVPDRGYDTLLGITVGTRLAWRLSDGRWVEVFDRGRPVSELASLATQVTMRAHALPRTIRVGLTAAGFTDVLTTETIGANSTDASLTLCPTGTVVGLTQPLDSPCARVGASPGTYTVIATEPAPVSSSLAGMAAQVDDGTAWYEAHGMSMSVIALDIGWSRAQMMAVLASASYAPA